MWSVDFLPSFSLKKGLRKEQPSITHADVEFPGLWGSEPGVGSIVRDITFFMDGLGVEGSLDKEGLS